MSKKLRVALRYDPDLLQTLAITLRLSKQMQSIKGGGFYFYIPISIWERGCIFKIFFFLNAVIFYLLSWKARTFFQLSLSQTEFSKLKNGFWLHVNPTFQPETGIGVMNPVPGNTTVLDPLYMRVFSICRSSKCTSMSDA